MMRQPGLDEPAKIEPLEARRDRAGARINGGRRFVLLPRLQHHAELTDALGIAGMRLRGIQRARDRSPRHGGIVIEVDCG